MVFTLRGCRSFLFRFFISLSAFLFPFQSDSKTALQLKSIIFAFQVISIHFQFAFGCLSFFYFCFYFSFLILFFLTIFMCSSLSFWHWVFLWFVTSVFFCFFFSFLLCFFFLFPFSSSLIFSFYPFYCCIFVSRFSRFNLDLSFIFKHLWCQMTKKLFPTSFKKICFSRSRF